MCRNCSTCTKLVGVLGDVLRRAVSIGAQSFSRMQSAQTSRGGTTDQRKVFVQYPPSFSKNCSSVGCAETACRIHRLVATSLGHALAITCGPSSTPRGCRRRSREQLVLPPRTAGRAASRDRLRCEHPQPDLLYPASVLARSSPFLLLVPHLSLTLVVTWPLHHTLPLPQSPSSYHPAHSTTPPILIEASLRVPG